MPAAARWPDILGNLPEFVFTPRAQHSIMRSRLDKTRISTLEYYLGCTHFLDRNRLFRIGRTSDIFVDFLFPAAQSMGVRLWISKTRSKAQIEISKKVRRSDFEFQAVVEGPNLNFVNMFEGPTLNFENPSRSELKFREKTLMSKCEFLNTVRRSIFKLRGPKHFVSRARLKDILIYSPCGSGSRPQPQPRPHPS